MATGPKQLGQIYAYAPMPKFIWVAELSTRVLYPKGEIVGEVIWDATANQHDPSSFLFIHYPDRIIINDRNTLKPDRFDERAINVGSYPVYRNNLEEVP